MIEYIEPSWRDAPLPEDLYAVWKGKEDTCTEFHDFNEPEIDPETGNPVFLTPTITTFYGHILTAPYGITIADISASRKMKLVDLTLHRVDGNTSKELTVRAWQGDNNTLHLVNPLPDEDEVFGPVHRKVFGKLDSAQSEKKDYLLNKLYYGDTAILDVDITEIVKPGKVLSRTERTSVK